jgi:hypothetical protein
MPVTPTTQPTTAVVPVQLMRDWNNYTDYLDKKGMKGHPDLDKTAFGDAKPLGTIMLEQYIRENPKTTITPQSVPLIQKAFQDYRDYVLKQVDSGNARLSDGVTKNTFMPHLSSDDGIAGHKTTQTKFPEAYLITRKDGVPIKVDDKGFAPVINPSQLK